MVKVKRALLSVSDKSGLEALAAALVRHGVELVSTGGTAAALRGWGHAVRDVAELTGSPEMMDGRVKTLHPRVHGGLLALRDDAAHLGAMADNGIVAIDLAVINLYPFAATVAKGAGRDEIIENIDIGGPAMVRSSAKNHAFVGIVNMAMSSPRSMPMPARPTCRCASGWQRRRSRIPRPMMRPWRAGSALPIRPNNSRPCCRWR